MLEHYSGAKRYVSRANIASEACADNNSPIFPTINASLRRPFGCTAESALINNPNILTDLQAVNLHSDAHDPMVTLRPAPRLEYN